MTPRISEILAVPSDVNRGTGTEMVMPSSGAQMLSTYVVECQMNEMIAIIGDQDHACLV